ncbi:hypothetical protein [Aquitalea sp. USM4]|uniref:hypothetical protein n=1 Tax=Aquitalea sp. USM4 TaxID=1590041 RepID=UPI00103CA421|nr:hypothetical protein [Aquitalea sp. USM4]
MEFITVNFYSNNDYPYQNNCQYRLTSACQAEYARACQHYLQSHVAERWRHPSLHLRQAETPWLDTAMHLMLRFCGSGAGQI